MRGEAWKFPGFPFAFSAPSVFFTARYRLLMWETCMGFERRIARRSVLRLGGGAVLATTVSALFGVPALVRADGANGANGAVPFALRSTWALTEANLAVTPLTSPPLLCDFPFNALESRWDAALPPGSVLSLSARTSPDGTTWTDWLPLTPDTHARDGETDSPTFGDLLIVGNALYAQYRIDAMSGMRGVAPDLRAFALTAVNTRGAGSFGDAPVHAEAFTGGNVIPRSGWGADENLRFDTDEKTKMRVEVWPLEFRPIQKVMIHHTVTRDPETDAKATLRAIYQYHAVMRGWGDIGYNFLIDQQGNVYEGRYGGKGVVGGHTLGYNYGSIGVAILGTYQDHAIPDPARAALLALIRAKAGDLDPTGQSFFVDRICPNINGHRGLVNSSCPGDAFYPTLNNLRRDLKSLPAWVGDPTKDPIAANPPDVIPPTTGGTTGTTGTTGSGGSASPTAPIVKAQITGVQWSGTSAYSRDTLTARVTVKNTGTQPFPAQDPPPATLYTEGETYTARRFPSNKGSLRVAIGPDANGADPPFRWGLGRPLDPGESVVVTVPFRLLTAQRTRYAVSLIYEGYGILDHAEPVQLSVSLNPTEPADAIREANNLFFLETKHNVAPEFKDYWNANGGVYQFGFPITEGYIDANPDDGKSYKVQYFERARFEYHPDQPDKRFQVELGRLGAVVCGARGGEKPFARVEKVADTGDRRYFAETGHTLSGTFKTYWETRGGLPIYGFPLCEAFEEQSVTDGKSYTVQYFERNRFEYHPENKGTPQEVLLGLLGSEVLKRRGWLT